MKRIQALCHTFMTIKALVTLSWRLKPLSHTLHTLLAIVSYANRLKTTSLNFSLEKFRRPLMTSDELHRLTSNPAIDPVLRRRCLSADSFARWRMRWLPRAITDVALSNRCKNRRLRWTRKTSDELPTASSRTLYSLQFVRNWSNWISEIQLKLWRKTNADNRCIVMTLPQIVYIGL